MRGLWAHAIALALGLVLVLQADAAASNGAGSALQKISGYQQAFKEGEDLDILVYMSTKRDPYLNQGSLFNNTKNPKALVYRNSTKFGWNVMTETVEINVTLPDVVQRNKSSLFAHVFVCRKGISPNPWDPSNKVCIDRYMHTYIRVKCMLPACTRCNTGVQMQQHMKKMTCR
jgi:hypothetical protein